MDIKARQLASSEQETVLAALAESAARPACSFLEVGSWCGDSSVILAHVAARHGGRLYCIDWWKGNPGTELGTIAQREDVFWYFWERIRREGLEEAVVPIRGQSEQVAGILARGAFQLVFLDADHRYEWIRADIERYGPMVSEGGILSGHDCEGRLEDYDPEFLEAGKDLDYHESVHCGVVLAVGRSFAEYSLDHSIWSVCKSAEGWRPAAIEMRGIQPRRQSPPPALGYSRGHRLLRYGKRVYALPHEMNAPDVRDDQVLEDPRVVSAASLEEVLARIQEEVLCDTAPELVLEGFHGFNIVRHAGWHYALAQAAGPVDMLRLSQEELAGLKRQGVCLVRKTLGQARRAVELAALRQLSQQVNQLQTWADETNRRVGLGQQSQAALEARLRRLEGEGPAMPAARLVAEDVQGFNIVVYRGRYYCLAQSLGPVDLERLQADQIEAWRLRGLCAVHDSLEEAQAAVRGGLARQPETKEPA